jgi:SHS2 domain-containing protein
MKREFEIIEHTADIGIRVFGVDIKEAFINAAKGMFSLITEPAGINEVLFRDVVVTATDSEFLLVEWLNELIYLFDVEYLLFSRFDILKLTDTELNARCYGEAVDRSRHELKTGIKAATYHMLKIEHNGLYRAQVLFDI